MWTERRSFTALSSDLKIASTHLRRTTTLLLKPVIACGRSRLQRMEDTTSSSSGRQLGESLPLLATGESGVRL
jgi:hypothetical protein